MASGLVAVTGPNGRLGRAVLAGLREAGVESVGWGRPSYDLDAPGAAPALFRRDSPGLVIHTAAWTDVDGCAREPARAQRRNAAAVEELSKACAVHGASLILVSTNEVFDGRRTTGLGYRERDAVAPINAYGRSKLAGELAARTALAGTDPRLWIVRTSWLFGPPGNDFPTKILAAADRLAPGQKLRVVADEFGSPTSTIDLAGALLGLVDHAPSGTYHVVNAGHASRAEWARQILKTSGRSVGIEEISQHAFERASKPPLWGVLDPSLAKRFGVELRPWKDALDDYLAPARAPR